MKVTYKIVETEGEYAIIKISHFPDSKQVQIVDVFDDRDDAYEEMCSLAGGEEYLDEDVRGPNQFIDIEDWEGLTEDALDHADYEEHIGGRNLRYDVDGVY